MDAKEAIYRIQTHMVIHKLYEPHAVLITEALNTAIKALVEQEPIAPYESEGDFICGNQGNECGVVGYRNQNTGVIEKLCNYCPMCGKKVDWDGIQDRITDSCVPAHD